MTWFQVFLGLAAFGIMLAPFVMVSRGKMGAVTPPIPPIALKATDRNSKGGVQGASDAPPIDVQGCKEAFVFRRLGFGGDANRSVITLCEDDGGECCTMEWTWGPDDGN